MRNLQQDTYTVATVVKLEPNPELPRPPSTRAGWKAH